MMGVVVIIKKLLGMYEEPEPETFDEKIEREHRAGHFSDDMSHVIGWNKREEIEIIGDPEDEPEEKKPAKKKER